MKAMKHEATSNDSRTSFRLAVVALVVLVILGSAVMTSRTRDGAQTSRQAEAETKSFRVEAPHHVGRSERQQTADVDAGADVMMIGNIPATSMNGDYYVDGDTTKCLTILGNPNSVYGGLAVMPSDALSSKMISGFGFVESFGADAMVISGKMYIFESMTKYGQKKFHFFGDSIIIGTDTYKKKKEGAGWTCPLGFSDTDPMSAPYSAFGFHNLSLCMWMKRNPNTMGFVFMYPPTISRSIQAAGGVFDLHANKGKLAGYGDKGQQDGGPNRVYNIKTDTSGTIHLYNETWHMWLSDNWRFLKVSTCEAVNYQSSPPCPRIFGSCSAETKAILGGGWKLVRRVGPSAGTWHPAADRLNGSDVYGTPGVSDTADVTFSIRFDNVYFNQFLFMMGDCSNWVITTPNNLLGGAYYDHQARQACATSVNPQNPTMVKWDNRQNKPEDPWVAVIDTWKANDAGMYVYGGARFANSPWTSQLKPRNGANVYIRAKANTDSGGC